MTVALNGMLDLTGVKSGRRAGRFSSERGHSWVPELALPLTFGRGPDGDVYVADFAKGDFYRFARGGTCASTASAAIETTRNDP
jgi:hypothetical protein